MSQREDFEEWHSDYGKWPKAVDKNSDDGSYKLMQARTDWAAWQAAQQKQSAKIGHLQKRVGELEKCLHNKNVALDAMQWVWCDGGCKTGVNRYTPNDLTLEIVEAAERNTKRLRSWFENAEFKKDGRT